jgi:hypothetical protein
MEFSKSFMQEKSQYRLRVETGETVEIVFDPDGVNAVRGRHNAKRALTVGTLSLPNGDLVLSILLNNDLLHKVSFRNGGPASLAACHGIGAKKSEFVIYGALPKTGLVLEKIDWQELLKPASSEEPSDG